MANREPRHHRTNVVNSIEDGTYIDKDRDVAETAVTFWDIETPVDVNVPEEITAVLSANDSSVKLSDGNNPVEITSSGELLSKINSSLPSGTNNIGKIEIATDNSGIFKTTDFTETRKITDIDTGGTQTSNLFTESQNHENHAWNSTTLTANTSETLSHSAPGAEKLKAQVKSTGTYNVELIWKDQADNIIRTEEIASSVSGGTWKDINKPAKSPYVDLKVTDTSGADQTIDGTTHLS